MNMKCVFCLKYFSFEEEVSEMIKKMYIALHVNYPLLLSDFMKREFYLLIFEEKTLKYKIS